ncbi:MAG: GIY-YIG nuclease family protein [Rhodospirillales bacterium]
MASRRNATIYTGVTSDLVRRVHQHREGSVEGFAQRYGCRLLVYFEICGDMLCAIAREKQVKAGSRNRELAPIESMNPTGWISMSVFCSFLYQSRSSSRAAERRGDPGKQPLDCFVGFASSQ